jgi:hypothetical protein
MAIKVISQKSYYVTEFNVETNTNLEELKGELDGMESTGKTVVVHNDGNILGINVEQKAKVPSDAVDKQIRTLMGLKTKEF